MANKRPPNKVHTSPERAGAQNMAKATPRQLKPDEDGLMGKLLPIYNKSTENRKAYKGLWTVEELEKSISDMFTYCYEVGLKPTKPTLILWLGISKMQFEEWRNAPQHKDKSYLIENAMLIMEQYLQCNIDKYPTGSIFLLKTTHGHVERSQVDINSGSNVSSQDINETIKKLGLGEDK